MARFTGRQRVPVFHPVPAMVSSCITSYPPKHFLGVAQELRDQILKHVDDEIDHSPRQSLGAHPVTGYEALPLVCKQLFYETRTNGDWTPSTRVVHHNQLGDFLEWAAYNTPALPRLRSLTIELPHNSPPIVFQRLAKLLRCDLTGLEELKIFGVGPDDLGTDTSSVKHTCGKHDTSVTMSGDPKLTIDGQGWQRRLVVVNSFQWLGKLKVLVLDNFNIPVTVAHVLKNKPHLQHLRVGADPRSTLHGEYRTSIGVLAFPLKEPAPAVKELDLTANGIFSACSIVDKVAETLEKFTYTVPSSYFQTTGLRGVNFLHEASLVLQKLASKALGLQELRICIHNGITETVGCGSFIGALKLYLSQMNSLKLLEMHIHSESQWIAQEFIISIPPSVERLYISHQLFTKNFHSYKDLLNWSCGHLLQDDYPHKLLNRHVDLNRKDFIPFTNDLGFVGYEFPSHLSPPQRNDLYEFLKLNGRLLDRERNKHLAVHQGKHIPVPQVYKTCDTKAVLHHENVVKQDPDDDDDIDIDIGMICDELRRCGLGDDAYFGTEDAAQEVFYEEPVAKACDRAYYSYPQVVAVEHEGTRSEHWLSS
ncbi:hypothetical protein LTR67_002908 [Exophiala xenobiotica]